MKGLLRFAAAFCTAVLIFSLCGCNGEEYDASIYADIGSAVSTLDPQLVQTSAERTVVLNTFEGLMKISADGTVIPAASEKYEKNGNVYTFTLRQGLTWNDGSALTAADFVFGLQRAAAKDTQSPEYQSISCIKGADAVHGGQDASLLGVTAADERTLKIELERDDGDFLETLTRPIAMPCNREFFRDTKGKYGRDDENILCNGPYYLQMWNSYDYKIKLRRNSEYNGENTAIPANVYITSDGDAERTQLIKKNSLDIAFVQNTDSTYLEENGLTVERYFTRSWFIFINKDGTLGNSDIRRALAMAIDRHALAGNMPDYMKLLDVAVPLVSKHSETDTYTAVKELAEAPAYEPDRAYRIYSDAAEKISSAGPLSIIYSGDGNIDSLVSDIASAWQRTLGCYINMTPFETNAGVLSTMKNGYYDVAVCAVDSVSDEAADFLSVFKSGETLSISNSEFDRAVGAVLAANDGYFEAVLKAQNLLTADRSIIPIAATPLSLAYSNSLSGVDYNVEIGYINFAKIVKK